MRKIAFHIEKGGAGKTTICGSIGYLLAKTGNKVLIVDGDPQGNLTSWLVTESMAYDLADVLQEKSNLNTAIKNVRKFDNGGILDLLPTFAIDGELKWWCESFLQQRPITMRTLIQDIDLLKYDMLLFDLSPGISLLEKSILACCDEVVGVVKAEYFSMDGIEIFQNELNKIDKYFGAKIKSDKLVLNMINLSFNIHKAYQKQITDLGYKVFTIGQSAKITEATTHHKTIFEIDSENRTISELIALSISLKKEI